MISLIASYDISFFVNWMANLFLSLFSFMFNLLDSIKFNGISILSYSVTLMILSCLIPLLISFAGYEYRQNQRNERRNRSKSKKGDEASA